MNLTLRDKIEIIAREMLYYRRQLESEEEVEIPATYNRMLKEAEDEPLSWIDAILKNMVLSRPGYKTLMKKGFVIQVDELSGRGRHVTRMTKIEVERMKTYYKRIARDNPKMKSPILRLQKNGWQLL